MGEIDKQLIQHHHARAVRIVRGPSFKEVVDSFKASENEETMAKDLEVNNVT
jgi:hypothetical protein